MKSAYLRKQDAPPLGINAAGKVSPIRPEFIVYFTEIRNDRPVGQENRLLAAEWKAFFPHTIRR
ncbi:MAG TPA: cytochrome C, partial [Syntrophus sp. (in: bacteria)]|nr:cytochrome C [Syntrophus sp. (in: bacteria)]